MVLEKTKTLLARIALIAVFVFAIYSNVGRVMKNNLINEKLKEQRAEVDELKTYNARLKDLLAYYQSSSYQEVEARRRLSMKLPDETVIQIKNFPTSSLNSNLVDQIYKESAPKSAETKTNAQQWWDYFFGN